MLLTLFSLFTKILHLMLGVTPQQKFPPPLSPDEEQEAFRLCRAGDARARERLILHNLRLVSHVVRKYYGAAKDPEDLVSIGTVGLVKAVDTFRIENGARFATYAAKCIQNEILMHFRAQRKQGCEVSLGETIDIDRDGNPLTYIDVICAEEDVAEETLRKVMTDRMLGLVNTLLTPREKQIVVLRYGLNGAPPIAQREVALQLGISRSYVSRIEKAALEKLKAALS